MSIKLPDKTQARIPDANLARYEVLVDNETTTITFWSFQPGDQTGWHRHDMAYVTYQMSEGRIRSEFADGSVQEFDYTPGAARYVPAVIEHNATNVGDCELRVLEIEYKQPHG